MQPSNKPSPHAGRLAGLSGLVLLFTACSGLGVTLDDFGYNTMLVNGKAASGTRPLLVILAVFTNHGPALSLTTNEIHNRVFAQPPTNSFSGFVAELSNNQFQWSEAGLVGPVQLGSSETLAAFGTLTAGNKDTQLFERLWFSNIVARVMKENLFNFSTYDTSPADGVVTGNELALIIFANDPGTPGMNRLIGPVQPPGAPVAVKSDMTTVRDDQKLHMLLHEGLHLLDTTDVYGRRGNLSTDLTLMGGNSDSSRIYHLDPWHKVKLGWSAPRIAQLNTGGVVNLPAAQLGYPVGSAILYDTNRGVGEYFLLEYRATNLTSGAGYDSGVAGEGLVIWQVSQNGQHNLNDHAALAYPNLERNWRWCENCWSLIRLADAGKPCPSTNHTSHALQGDNKDHWLLRDAPSAPGEQDWRRCSRCGGLFYGPEQAGSRCPAPGGGPHDPTGSGNYCLSLDSPDLVRDPYCYRCWRCEMLFFHHPDPAKRASVCPAGGLHGAIGRAYPVVALGNPAMMTRGTPDLLLGGNTVWTSSTITPFLRWYDETATPYRLFVRPFNPGDDTITVEWWKESDTWVDFNYAGTEKGTESQPYNTFGEGNAAVPHGGTLRIKPGNSPESGRVTKRVKIQAEGGPATIGR